MLRELEEEVENEMAIAETMAAAADQGVATSRLWGENCGGMLPADRDCQG